MAGTGLSTVTTRSASTSVPLVPRSQSAATSGPSAETSSASITRDPVTTPSASSTTRPRDSRDWSRSHSSAGRSLPGTMQAPGAATARQTRGRGLEVAHLEREEPACRRRRQRARPAGRPERLGGGGRRGRRPGSARAPRCGRARARPSSASTTQATSTRVPDRTHAAAVSAISNMAPTLGRSTPAQPTNFGRGLRGGLCRPLACSVKRPSTIDHAAVRNSACSASPAAWWTSTRQPSPASKKRR